METKVEYGHGDTVAVDFDGTISEYHGFVGPLVLGEPIPKMVERVKKWMKAGASVVIFTGRINVDDPQLRMQIIMMIQAWCKKNLGVILEVTDKKHGRFKNTWDDNTIRVVTNTGDVFDGADDEIPDNQ